MGWPEIKSPNWLKPCFLDTGTPSMTIMKTMRTLRIPLILACLMLAACVNIRDGVVVKKCARSGMPDVYGEEFGFRYEPDVYWVEVQGKDAKGRERVKSILLFRHDWNALRVGDHWSKQHGFSPAEAGGK